METEPCKTYALMLADIHAIDETQDIQTPTNYKGQLSELGVKEQIVQKMAKGRNRELQQLNHKLQSRW